MTEHHDKPTSHNKESDTHHKPTSHNKESDTHHKPTSHNKESDTHHKPTSHHKKDDETFTITKVALWQICSVVLLVLLAVSILTGGFGISLDFDKDSAPEPTPIAPTAPVQRVEVDIGDSPVLGSKNAPVTIIEFSDFECPFCARWYTNTKGQLDEQYIKTGKVKLVYMHYPLNFHPQAMPAALASECAYEQGKFWEFHDLIFENQQAIGEANYKKWAGELGLDQGQFDDCYDSGKYEADVQDDFSKGQGAGIRGTPGFLVNGRLVSGAQPFQVFQAAIETELNG